MGTILLFPKIFAQVGINTTDPKLLLSIGDSNTGFSNPANDKISTLTANADRLTVDGKYVGIHNVNPTKILDINAGNKFLRIENLANVASVNNQLAYPLKHNPADGTLGYLNNSNVYTGIQTLRIVVNETQNIAGNSTTIQETPLTLKSVNSTINGFSNFFNDISGSAILYAQNLPAGNGTSARTTDQIQLPAGVYRIMVKLTGRFSAHHKNNSLDIKLAVDNNEYSFANGVNYGDGTAYKTGYFMETVNLLQTSKLDFTYVKQTGANNAGSNSSLFPDSGDHAVRSIITIERLK
ncbi:hypothetical protein N0B16_02150 [Chryseobacterium sp. GMJ5]|uniref:Uncharacterized protein n=1 Tax=Chryseobacterium gilvum TaxID=2976534 RepID=A0ABT2VT98_9FLAO|nr:hypothetical protein [Chryseobacterium gilvum]MCU7613225.1 hypothetical protein [Chryseobacterium gilvum]